MELLGSTLYNVIAMLVTLGILVTIHEYGHFMVARWCGVRVERFSIGFGKPLLRWRGKPVGCSELGTEYVISALPLGGYVKMLGEQDDDVSPAMRAEAFDFKPLYQRAAIVAAGPVANFLLAVLLYCGIFYAGTNGLAPVIGNLQAGSVGEQASLQAGDEILAIDGQATSTWQDVRIALLERLGETGNIEIQVKGIDSTQTRTVAVPVTNWHADTDQPDLMGSLGIIPYHQFYPPVLEEVLEGRAEQAGLRAGDLIQNANGQEIHDWTDFLTVIKQNTEQTIALQFLRDGLVLQTSLTPAMRVAEDGSPVLDEQGNKQGYIGARVVVPKLPAWMNRKVDYSLFEAVPQAVSETARNSLFVLVSMKKMLFGDISLKNLSGPITIAQVAGETASYGLGYYVNFLALLSISLGVLNLLPIPVLDGGLLFYYVVEAVIRRPVPRRVRELGLQFGMMLVACIMLLALFNDVNRLL